MKTKYIITLLFIIMLIGTVNSQQPKKEIKDYTREEVLEIPYEKLVEMSLEDLIKLADIVGVSVDELYELILNKDVVSASKKAESSFEAPLSTSVLSYDEIVESGVTCIAEALRLVPGVIVRQKTNGNYDVHIRGNDNVPPGNMLLYSENSMSLIMIDNRVVYNYAHGGAFWETLPIGISDIERIEVVRGPSSALYGPNAVTGVIHIITKRYEENKSHVHVDAQMGTQNAKIIGFNAGTKAIDNLWINVSANYQYRERFEDEFYLWERGYKAPIDSLTVLTTSTGELYERDTNLIDKRFPDPKLARDNYGINVNIFYQPIDKIQIDLSGGLQSSDVITTPLDNPYYALTRRTSETKYIDFKAKAYGVNAQLSYMYGPQDVSATKLGMQYDLSTLDAILEYDYKIGKLGIRPGISYRQANYDDNKYVNVTKKEGFLNGNREISTISGGIRLDYNATDKLRFIGAIRADKYNYPDKSYLTYQTGASYLINDKHMVRGVYSRANRSPFIVDTYAGFDWYRIEVDPTDLTDPLALLLPQGGHFYFNGNKDLKLATMDMVELGYRTKPNKHIQIDLEGFYTKTTNFDWFQLDSLSLLSVRTLHTLLNQIVDVSQKVPYDAYFNYNNLDVVSKQIGVTLNVSTVVSKKLYFKVFATIQQTKLENYKPLTINDAINTMMDNALLSPTLMQIPLANDTINNLLTSAYYSKSNTLPDSSVSVTHKSTPAFYGGFIVNYSPVKKLNINISTYMYGKQTLVHSFENAEIKSKVIVNFKVSYKVWNENSVFFNARNLLNTEDNEFAFTDKIGGLYTFGLNINFY